MRKSATYVIFFVFMFLFYSCGGGGGSSATTYLNLTNYSISTNSISKSNPEDITFSWNTDYSSPNNEYYMDIYISKDGTLNSNDIPIASKISNLTEDNITITPSSLGYQHMLNLYGGIYYIIFDAYTYDGSGKKIETLKSIPNFALKNIWTVMVYMDGDNSLSDATTVDLDEMIQIGSDSNVGVVVQDDTIDNTTKRYFVEPDKLTLLSNLGELNMGSYNTLINFGKWAIDSYPADHYLLVLWDHGKGFENAPSKLTRDILWDDHPYPGYSMTIPDLSKALSSIKDYIGKKIDIVGMDACLMNMIEVAYGIKNSADYMVGSENTEPFNGWPYNNIISYLESNVKTISAGELSKTITADYIDYYSSDSYPTQSSIDLNNIDNLTASVSALATTLINGLNSNSGDSIYASLTETIFNNVQRFDDNGDGALDANDSYADLYNLAQLIYQNDNMTEQIKSAAQNVMDELKKAVVSSYSKNAELQNSNGLSIWFPNLSVYNTYYAHYDNLTFVKNTEWNEFLKTLLSY